jgi:hypothetical protein
MGITNADKFLEKCRTPKERRDLAASLGMEPKFMTEIVNRADLARIHGVAGAFSDLLENAGVDSVKELAVRVPTNLHDKLVEVNTEKKIAARTPTLEQVQEWIAEAKTLPKILES